MTRAGATAARALDRPAAVLALYALATLLLTWPLGFRIGSHLPLGAGDLWQNLWNFWWWKTALFELHTSPYHTGYLFHPDGVSLAFHTHSPLNVLATLPVSLLFGIEAAYGVALLLGFVAAGFGAYLLVREWTGEPRAAFLAGLVFAFAPAHFEQSLEHLNLASIGFVPLFLFALLRLLRRGGSRRALGAGLAFAAVALSCWPYALLAALLGAALALREGGVRARARPLGLATAIAAAVVAPFAWPLLREALGAGGAPGKPFENLGTDPAFWLIPSDHHPVLGPLTGPLYAAGRRYLSVGFLSYLGWVPLALALRAASSRRWGGERRGFWAGCVGIFLLLSLGGHPSLLGHPLPGTFPHALLEGVPLLGWLRVANRFALFAMLGVAVLAGASWAALFRTRRERAAWLLGAAAMFEFLWVPYPLQRAEVHPYMQRLAADPEAGAVLPVPFPIFSPHSRALYDQTRHHRPIVGGYVSYTPPRALRSIQLDPLLATTAAGLAPPATIDPEALARLGIGTVLVHRDRSDAAYRARLESETGGFYARRAQSPSRGHPALQLEALLERLRAALGAPIYEDEALVVFRVHGGRPESRPHPGRLPRAS